MFQELYSKLDPSSDLQKPPNCFVHLVTHHGINALAPNDGRGTDTDSMKPDIPSGVGQHNIADRPPASRLRPPQSPSHALTTFNLTDKIGSSTIIPCDTCAHPIRSFRSFSSKSTNTVSSLSKGGGWFSEPQMPVLLNDFELCLCFSLSQKLQLITIILLVCFFYSRKNF